MRGVSTFVDEAPGRRAALVAWTFTGCLPQTLLSLAALLVQLFPGAVAEPFRGALVIRTPLMRRLGGVCLGPVILVHPGADEALVRHEWGHFRQHLRLGPLYLLVVGLPSVTHAAWHLANRDRNYFHFYTEAWADELGGVYDRHAHVHARWWGYAWAPALLLGIVAVTVAAFWPALGWGLTDADAWADVAWARRPLAEQLLVPLTGGVAGDNANFWRPAFMVEMWALRAAFGWSAAGYHAVDLTLHVVVSALVALVTTRLMLLARQPHRALATFAGLGFAAHPLAEEIVPAVARNIDLLLGVGFFGAVAALAGLSLRGREGGSRRAGWVWYAGLVLLALGSKESAVLLAPLAAALVLLLRDDLPLRSRLGEAARVTLPVAVAAGVYLAVRADVIQGLGGYFEEEERNTARWLVGGLKVGFVEPFVPAVCAWLQGMDDARTWVATAAAWAVVAWAGWRSPARRVFLFATVWFVLFLGLFAVTGTVNRRVFYVPTAAGLLMLGVPFLDAWRRRSIPVLALAGLWGATFLYGSPAVVRYPDWGEAGRAGDVWLSERLWRAIPPGSVAWLVDRPYRVDLDPRRFRLWKGTGQGLAHTPVTYSIQAWVDERLPDADLRLRSLTHWYLRRPVAGQVVQVEVDQRGLVVRREGGRRGVVSGGAFDVVEEDGALRLELRRRSPRPDVVVVWGPYGAWVWNPRTSELTGPM